MLSGSKVPPMSTLTIQLDDEAARLVEKAAQTVNQPLEHWLRESVCQAAARTVGRRESAPVPYFAFAPGGDGARARFQRSLGGVRSLRLTAHGIAPGHLAPSSGGTAALLTPPTACI